MKSHCDSAFVIFKNFILYVSASHSYKSIRTTENLLNTDSQAPPSINPIQECLGWGLPFCVSNKLLEKPKSWNHMVSSSVALFYLSHKKAPQGNVFRKHPEKLVFGAPG